MHFELISIIVAAAAAITAAAMLYDWLYYRLPNYLIVLLLALYPAWLIVCPIQIAWWWDVLLALGIMAFGFGLYALRMLGAGDVKMLAVTFMWLGLPNAFDYFIWFALFGGLESLLLLFGRPFVAAAVPQEKLPRVLQLRAPVPYGLAIGSAFILQLTHLI